MRPHTFVLVLALIAGAGSGCSSSAGKTDGGSGGVTGAGGATGSAGTTGASGTTGSAGTTGTGGSSASDGGQTCSPACGSGSICVGSGTEGGAVIMPNDAGVCPAGRHLAGNACVNDLSYACKAIPAGCGGTVTCTCASSLCPTSYMCQGPSNGVLTCVLAVP
jgi:hypothetical protein